MKRSDVARVGADRLKRVEAAIWSALGGPTGPAGAVLSIRLDAQLSRVVCMGAVTALGESLASILSTRIAIVNFHTAFAAGETYGATIGLLPRSGLRVLSGGRAAYPAAFIKE